VSTARAQGYVTRGKETILRPNVVASPASLTFFFIGSTALVGPGRYSVS
jgi:hypothetical protein